jgi:hypothetical protein
MTKSSGLGQFLLVGGVDLSGDVGSLNNVHGGPAENNVTAINKSAPERIGGVLDGGLDYTAFFNDAVGHAHAKLSALPTGDVLVLYGMASTIGAQAAGLVSKQLDYAGTRAQDGALTFGVPHPANGYGLEWCDLVTAGLRTDTAATNGASLDNTAATTTGWSAYLAVTAFTGTDVTVKLQDSADNSSWSDVTAGGFTAVTAAPATQRIEGAAGATLRRYVRAVTTTSAGVTSVTFAVGVCRHPAGATA